MSVTVRPYMGGLGWEVDIRVRLADGTMIRDRKKAPVSSRSEAKRWGEARQREILQRAERKAPKEVPEETQEVVPTLREFAPRFIEGHAQANRFKPSGIAATKTILDTHLIPELGDRPLDKISSEDVQILKSQLQNRAEKTVNNILTTLNTLLKVAVEWGIISEMPCQVRLVRVPRNERPFHDFEDFERLVQPTRADIADLH